MTPPSLHRLRRAYRVQPSAGSAIIHVRNGGSGALNGTIKISFAVIN